MSTKIEVDNDIKLFAGNATPKLARSIAENLNLSLGKATVGRFSDGEIMIEILENVRGKDTFIIQSTCTPANDHLMELIIIADALMRASARSITAVVPYFGYARQDRRIRSARVPITAKVVADMLCSVGIKRLITADLHAEQVQGFFDIPVDNVYASSVMLKDIKERLPKTIPAENMIVVSPDVGGVVRARAIAKRLNNNTDLAIIDKRRPSPNHAQIMNVIGDVKDRHCILVDDMIDTAGTLCAAASSLKDNGAASVRAYCTHAILSGDALEKIKLSELDEVVVTDTIPLTAAAQKFPRVTCLSLSNVFAETIHRVTHQESVSSMFAD